MVHVALLIAFWQTGFVYCNMVRHTDKLEFEYTPFLVIDTRLKRQFICWFFVKGVRPLSINVSQKVQWHVGISYSVMLFKPICKLYWLFSNTKLLYDTLGECKLHKQIMPGQYLGLVPSKVYFQCLRPMPKTFSLPVHWLLDQACLSSTPQGGLQSNGQPILCSGD